MARYQISSTELEPTRPDLPSGIATYRIRDRKMIELIQARLMVDLEKYCEKGHGWESMPNLQPGEEALRRTRSAGRLSMRYLYKVLFDTRARSTRCWRPECAHISRCWPLYFTALLKQAMETTLCLIGTRQSSPFMDAPSASR